MIYGYGYYDASLVKLMLNRVIYAPFLIRRTKFLSYHIRESMYVGVGDRKRVYLIDGCSSFRGILPNPNFCYIVFDSPSILRAKGVELVDFGIPKQDFYKMREADSDLINKSIRFGDLTVEESCFLSNPVDFLESHIHTDSMIPVKKTISSVFRDILSYHSVKNKAEIFNYLCLYMFGKLTTKSECTSVLAQLGDVSCTIRNQVGDDSICQSRLRYLLKKSGVILPESLYTDMQDVKKTTDFAKLFEAVVYLVRGYSVGKSKVSKVKSMFGLSISLSLLNRIVSSLVSSEYKVAVYNKMSFNSLMPSYLFVSDTTRVVESVQKKKPIVTHTLQYFGDDVKLRPSKIRKRRVLIPELQKLAKKDEN